MIAELLIALNNERQTLTHSKPLLMLSFILICSVSVQTDYFVYVVVWKFSNMSPKMVNMRFFMLLSVCYK